ncbi:Bug family tripartite tricarboxylate transporter substrate binding protein [Advenella mimigardefordensis]|uniref:Putative Bug-like extracytoplasmic solute binding receptor, TTT family n=1 Tax=Advenella mimigardefordensis (strain DSM 17166 / LMG 22922 / DPN7) TaxID=1247726 RepID=W0PEY4_ADVMD|nr:tripartite tricarboxylate transporter substrate-binding protein [Advenella mimigardefordensis]AHG63840.1 putative Bug-like extracytoplasmic solute binding receptor, TTT family [Advenella mimigardefordensis DPN7]
MYKTGTTFWMRWAIAITTLNITPAHAEEPNLPETIKLIVGYPPGGSVDIVARLLAQPLSKTLGKNVIIENRPGAGGRIAAGTTKHASTDGSVVMIAPNALTTIQTLVYDGKLTYDITKDFTPVSRLASYPFALSVNAKSDIKNVADLNQWLQNHPEQSNYGSSSAGGMAHFSGLLYGKAANVNWTHVAFNGGSPLINGILGDHIVAGIDTLIDHHEQFKAGNLRILGLFSQQRYALAPEIPTLEEQGVKGLNVEGWYGAYVPAATDPAVVHKLDEALGKTMTDAEFVKKLNQLVIQPAYLSSPDFKKLQDQELKSWAPTIQESGFKP